MGEASSPPSGQPGQRIPEEDSGLLARQIHLQ